MADTPNGGLQELVAFVKLIKERQARAAEMIMPPAPISVPEGPFNNWRLQWKSGEETLDEPEKAISIDELRAALPENIYIHLDSGRGVLLIKAPPGGGKTHAAVQAAQRAAKQGLRILWAAPYHRLFTDIQNIPGFAPHLWYHWLAIGNPDPVMCQHSKSQHIWADKGYNSMRLCLQLCRQNGHINNCPFRLQMNRAEPIVFAMHQHLVSGLQVDAFDAVIIDELPLGAFVRERKIKTADLPLKDAAFSPAADIVDLIYCLSRDCQPGTMLSGKKLMERIAPTLARTYEEIEVFDPDVKVDVPRVRNHADVEAAPYWYLFQMLTLLYDEWVAFKNGWQYWSERVFINAAGLTMLLRNETWEHLPARVTALDATGEIEIYKPIFGDRITEYAPKIQRKGRIYQIVGRLYGKNKLKAKETDETREAREMVETVKMLIQQRGYKNVGVVCLYDVRKLFEDAFGADKVLNFYGQRGTNRLKDVDALFVCGTPSPDGQRILNMGVALTGQIEPLVGMDPKTGKLKPIYTYTERVYRLTSEARQRHKNRQPYRQIGGYWTTPILRAIHAQMREKEIRQAIDRARTITNDVDVWVLSSVALDMEIDEIYDAPPIAPDGIHWRYWLKIAPFLDSCYAAGEAIDYQRLADAAGVGISTVQHGKWLDVIMRVQPERWQIAAIAPITRGRPKNLLNAKQ